MIQVGKYNHFLLQVWAKLCPTSVRVLTNTNIALKKKKGYSLMYIFLLQSQPQLAGVNKIK